MSTRTRTPLLSALSLFIIIFAFSTTSVDARVLQGEDKLAQQTAFPDTSNVNARAIAPVASDDDAVFCTLDAKICPDGSFVGRVPPSCEFAPCPSEVSVQDPNDEVMCAMDMFTCPDGTLVARVPPSCEFAPCPPGEPMAPNEKEEVMCAMDMFTCPDGTLVARVPPSCEFPVCAEEKPRKQRTTVGDHGVGLQDRILQDSFSESEKTMLKSLSEEARPYFRESRDTRAYANMVREGDHRISEITIEDSRVEVTYTTHGKLFGLFRNTYSSKVIADINGDIKVKKPWYTLLMTGTTHRALKKQVQTTLADTFLYSNPDDLPFEQATIIEGIVKSIRNTVDDAVYLTQ